MAEPVSPPPPFVRLPDEDTDEGALVRLLLVEVGDQPDDPDGVKQAMGLIKRVIENRLQKPKDFYANHATIRDIIQAHHIVAKFVNHKKIVLLHEQIAGFMNYPRLSEKR